MKLIFYLSQALQKPLGCSEQSLNLKWTSLAQIGVARLVQSW
jgi:hypothetical protein